VIRRWLIGVGLGISIAGGVLFLAVGDIVRGLLAITLPLSALGISVLQRARHHRDPASRRIPTHRVAAAVVAVLLFAIGITEWRTQPAFSAITIALALACAFIALAPRPQRVTDERSRGKS
jgi:peptidoglycan/LPS O-acetylase OafA/YrhL